MTACKSSPLKSFKVVTLLNGKFELKNDIGKRHPLGRYNSSISNVLKYLGKIVDGNNLALQTKIYNSKQPNYDILTDALVNFMSFFMTHIEVMGGIINDFYPEKKDQDKIRKELNKLDARSYVATIINHIKHNGGTLNPASIINLENEAVLGFFVEGYDDDSIGPCKVVHSKGDDIISINYFVRKVTADIFLVDNFIASSIEKFIQLGKEEKCDESLLGILDKINNLPLRFFDKEYKRNHLMYSMKNGVLVLEHLKFKRNMIMNGRISVSYTADGVTRTFKIPLGAAT
ncbi:hypothetical protein [Serratia marcescens]|uniref:hypothetical protein n=1 Tax=Serratia marcescens TaxID=615 RepID=UPI00148DBBB4|nr:hypothetical protein [Serratia marcescens]